MANTIQEKVAAYVASTPPEILEIFSGEDLQDHLVTERMYEIKDELAMARDVEADCLYEDSRRRDLAKAQEIIRDLIAERKELFMLLKK